jgi:hypothetical protein
VERIFLSVIGSDDGGFVRTPTFQSRKMLHHAPTAASTGRTAASRVVAGRRLWAAHVGRGDILWQDRCDAAKGRDGHYSCARAKRALNRAFERRRPSSVNTTDFVLPTGSKIRSFWCSRPSEVQSCPFQARRSLCSVSHSSARTASSILSSSIYMVAADTTKAGFVNLNLGPSLRMAVRPWCELAATDLMAALSPFSPKCYDRAKVCFSKSAIILTI